MFIKAAGRVSMIIFNKLGEVCVGVVICVNTCARSEFIQHNPMTMIQPRYYNLDTLPLSQPTCLDPYTILRTLVQRKLAHQFSASEARQRCVPCLLIMLKTGIK